MVDTDVGVTLDEDTVTVDDDTVIPDETITIVVEPIVTSDPDIGDDTSVTDNEVTAVVVEVETLEIDDKDGSIDIMTIGIYTGGVIFAILVIFCVIMIVEKVRRRNKRITEIIEFKPVNLDAHFKGVEERAPKGKPKPKRTPVPII